VFGGQGVPLSGGDVQAAMDYFVVAHRAVSAPRQAA
jgi:hypothetical protein